MPALDRLDILFIAWAFFFQVVYIIHFAVRKRVFEIYTLKYGWTIYALSIPAVVISAIILLGGKAISFWLGGFLFLVFAAFGYWVDYVMKIQFRNPLRTSVVVPYVLLYLATTMFYWFPLGQLSKPAWYIFAVLFIVGTVLNVRSH